MWLSNLNIPSYGDTHDATTPIGTDMYCRDPYILLAGDTYYLYCRGTDTEPGIFCRTSKDLSVWSDKIPVYLPVADFHGENDLFWAPECHYYRGNFYIFTSVRSKRTGKHAISVYRSSSPLGPFEDIAGGCITPPEWDCIDGTLYIDEEGAPFMVFVREWISMPDGNGAMVASRLSDDLTHLISEPAHLFYAKDPKWVKKLGITDGPYLYRAENGTLFMIWSNFADESWNEYAIGVAHSESGSVLGPWIHHDTPLFTRGMAGIPYDGGHGMIFYTKEGKPMLSMHGPNRTENGVFEHVILLPLEITQSDIRLAKA